MRGQSTLTRRTLLSTIGAGFTAGVIGTDAAATRGMQSEYILVQGDTCVPIRPMGLQVPVDTFYDYELPRKHVSEANGASVGDTAQYASAGTRDLQRAQTSLLFLYQGPQGLSLVAVHGSVGSSDGGSVTFRLTGLPEGGDWVVKDDLYRNPDTGDKASTNYDRWDVDGTDHRIDWTWGSGGTDGGVFRGLGDDFEVVMDPAFNGDAALHDKHYEGTVTDWEFLSGSTDSPVRVSLSLDEPIRIMTGSCEQADDVNEENEKAAKEADEREAESEDDEKERENEEDEKEAENEGEEDENREKYTVCHKPPGNPDNARTIQVGSKSALNEHLGHGDEKGPCSGDE